MSFLKNRNEDIHDKDRGKFLRKKTINTNYNDANFHDKKKIGFLPLETAVWLEGKTALTFVQIAEFCGLPVQEVQAIADGLRQDIVGADPTKNGGPLTAEIIQKCTEDPNKSLWSYIDPSAEILMGVYSKRKKRIPIIRRQDKPNAIAWLLKNCSEIGDNNIIRLIGTTRLTIDSIRHKTHWNIANIQMKSPVALGLCSDEELDHVVFMAKTAEEKKQKMRLYSDQNDLENNNIAAAAKGNVADLDNHLLI